jgi:hypothetical protein
MTLRGPDSPPPPGTAVTPAAGDEALIEAVAARVVRMGLAVPAIFFLESTKPLSYVGSQVLVFFEPFVKTFLTVQSYQRFVALMEDRRNMERLIVRIEDLDELARRSDAERKKREKAERKARCAMAPGPATGRSFRSRIGRWLGRDGTANGGERNGRG